MNPDGTDLMRLAFANGLNMPANDVAPRASHAG